jgi:hypothetical protein
LLAQLGLSLHGLSAPRAFRREEPDANSDSIIWTFFTR